MVFHQTKCCNDFFATEAEMRLAWALYSLANYGVLRPFPADRPATPILTKPQGRDLVETSRQVNLAEYAPRFMCLGQAGSGKWRGLCPIQQERTFSFCVFTDLWTAVVLRDLCQWGDRVAVASELKRSGFVNEGEFRSSQGVG